ncbi:MAG: hypothetical protein JW893_04975 [Candidatus Omnitrophica bacterium]|nr:hypothetical protein [Candidatus Omnitrophota bacterium]
MRKMKTSHHNLIMIITLGLFSMAFTHTAYAKPYTKHHPVMNYRPRPPITYYRHLPAGYLTLRLSDALYYYFDGTYYTNTPSGYVIVNAPVGTRIVEIPSRHKEIIYGGTTYYYYDHTYYLREPEGYTVVTPPADAVALNTSVREAPEKTVVVNVPNPNGSFMPVTLQKFSDGYVGPKGEFYPDYPTLDQLKAMYAKASATVVVQQDPEELVVDVPNTNGSYTKVTLVKSQDGYVGPEGEFYPEKPTVEQLKLMYAKGV